MKKIGHVYHEKINMTDFYSNFVEMIRASHKLLCSNLKNALVEPQT